MLDRYRLFFLGCLVFFCSFGLWLRSSLFGFDSYASLAAVRFEWVDNFLFQPFALIVWGVLPDSLFVFNIVMFLCLFLSIVPLFLLVKHFYDERSAWVSVFLLFGLSPLMLFEFGQLENEIFAYPLILWSIYWFLTAKSKFDLVRCFFCLVFACGFWLFPFYLTFFNSSSNINGAIEQSMFSGLLNFWFLLFFVFFIPLLGGRLKWFGVVGVFLWLWNAKLFVFLVPFVVLSIPLGLDWLEKRVMLKKHVVMLCFLFVFGFNVAFLLQAPTNNDWFLVDKTINLSNDTNLPIFNDWSYGYWFWSKGLKVLNNPGSGLNINFDGTPGIYLTDQNMPCVLVYEKKEIARKEKKIWQCN
jgi:hypothetical protein